MKKIFFSLFILAAASGTIFYFFYPPRVQSWTADSKIVIKFDKPVKRQMISHLIKPEVLGEWTFEDSLIENHLFRSLIFTPAIGFEADTDYAVNLYNIANTFGMGSVGIFSFNFKTSASQAVSPEPKVTLIDVPLDWQDYPLSCEAASLKMALYSKGVYVSEDEIIEKIGYDTTPHLGNFWGDPDKGFVGNIYGDICKTGYGVYWRPVAKAASHWLKAEAFSNWTLGQLLQEIEKGNPVIFWGVLPTGKLTDCSWWYAKEGKRVKAFYETHVRLVVGFIGDSKAPSKIIINDPLSGRLYWDPQDFLANWQVFGYSGVAIR